MYLHDSTANKDGIFEAFAAMERNMEAVAGQDLAVVMFSGHGTMIDGQFYLVPYGADNSTPGSSEGVCHSGNGIPERNQQARRAWPGAGFARCVPFGRSNWGKLKPTGGC